MKFFYSLLSALLLLALCDVNAFARSFFVFSISQSHSDEVIVAEVWYCNRSCTIDNLSFANGVASLNSSNLQLTDQEIADLNAYFFTIKQGGGCSKPIRIGFKSIVRGKTMYAREPEIFPCPSGGVSGIDPIILIEFLKRNSDEIPYWRQS